MRIPQLLAFYLPQFHRVDENDRWWGEGFTEWTTVRAGRPLFHGHKQPVVPFDYYDLLQKDVMKKQADMMHRYHLDGMCFYHYYFEQGKKILEKPAENLLQWQEINMPFCFYWANESWVRSWSNIDGNAWMLSEKNEETEGILLRQNYGQESEWKEHFYYLLPFFKDSRYIKKEGHPIFIIYKPQDITCLKEMKDCWNQLMKKEGLPDIYFIGRDTDCDILEGVLMHEPANSIGKFTEDKFQNKYGLKYYLSYDAIWDSALKQQNLKNNVYYSGIVKYDDTPRRGYSGTLIYGATPDKFKSYLIRLLIKAGHQNSDYVFVNAWNEWGEGMYLEPDLESGESYLQALKEAKEYVEENSMILSEIIEDNKQKNEALEYNIIKSNDRCKEYNHILSKWLNRKVNGKTITQYLIDNNMRKIAIYGMGMLGIPLYTELLNEHFEVLYGIDQDSTKADGFDVPVYQLGEELEAVDLIIVTVHYAYESIKKKLLEQGNFEIISLNELLEYSIQR